MTLVLLAVDESEESILAARQAHDLFGADASYLAVNVSAGLPRWTSSPAAWGAVYPYPYAATYPLVEEEVWSPATETALERARDVAEDRAQDAGVHVDDAVGEIGDPATAILDAAEANHADVIVLGVTDKSWWRRLVEGSVSKEIAKRSTRPVLIAGRVDADT